jgi:lipopolysaccharide/colanic/teichoic acid biosynthesis glycosyltransferase
MSRLEVSAGEFLAAEIADASPAQPKVGRAVDVACRTLDVLIASVMLVVLMPVVLLVALAIRLDSPGPALFRQRRFGRDLEPFTVLKFRTMYDGADDRAHHAFVAALIAGDAPEQAGEGPKFKMHGDPRITRLGHYLRRSSLDELPQLWNVLSGQMSLVGPRPPLSYEVENYPEHWFRRFAVKPGVTGLWQVSGRSNLTLEEMIDLDVEYVERRSPLLNLWIMLRTIPVVLSRRGAS